MGDAEGADEVVEPRRRPEVGARRPEGPIEGVFGAVNVRAHFVELLPAWRTSRG